MAVAGAFRVNALAPVVALVGAESTGKSTLAQALAQQVETAWGWRVACVDEWLRSWCEQQGRTPRPDEQAGVAARQRQRIALARSQAQLVVADTSALMVAVYSQHLFGDDALLPAALDDHRGYALTLLTRTDLPWVADGLRDGPQAQAPVDRRLRQALDGAGLPWVEVGGAGPLRLQAAWAALQRAVGGP